MQEKNLRVDKFTIELGNLLREYREKKCNIALEKLAFEYGLSKSTLSKIERGVHHCKVINLWKISEALGIKCSDLIKLLEDRLGKEFHLIDE